MPSYIQVKFKGNRTDIYENYTTLDFKIGEYVVVEAEKGQDLGRVHVLNPEPDQKKSKKHKDGFKRVIRKSKPDDFIRVKQNGINEGKALGFCQKCVDKHQLKMKLVDCEYQWDGNKITFYFTADKRVDFRELVKDLAAEFRTRIELRQIGVRDESKRIGGYGICGRQLCCSSWISEFKPITTQAAKDQNLPLNPNKLAGVCGRLKCCLMYERDFYNWAVKQYPELAKEYRTNKGKAIIQRIDIFRELVQIRYRENDEVETLPLAEIKEKIYKCQNDCGHGPGNLEDLTGNAN